MKGEITQMKSKTRLAFGLVELLIVIAIMAVLAAIIYPRYFGAATMKDGKKVSTPMSMSHDTECISNIRSVRQAIEAAIAGDADSTKPKSLSELKLPAEILKCAVGKEEYVYDPVAGTVKCPHPSHESY